MSSAPSLGRVDSMDQFRGFTVMSMFIVNFVHHMGSMHPFWKHNDNYVTFADWIMPGFIFAVGFSYRLTVLKRLEAYGPWKTYSTYFRRSLALILVSLMMYGWGGDFRRWDDFTKKETITLTEEETIAPDDDQYVQEEYLVSNTTQFVMQLIKSNLWEVLAIIGVAQIFIMPVIAAGTLVRFLAMVGCLFGHFIISWIFNWGFVHGYEHNWMVELWRTGGNRSWDGGFFGIMSWSVAMLAGTLVYDILVSNSRGHAGGKVFLFAAVFMIIGYVLSCGTRFYDAPLDPAAENKEIAEQVKSLEESKKRLPPNIPTREGDIAKYAYDPMIPDFSKAAGRSWKDLLAEPPFVMPPHPDQQEVNKQLDRRAELQKIPQEELTKKQKKELDRLSMSLLGVVRYDHSRKWNYWMMYKRMVSMSFILFATGFAIALYALFILASDIGGLHIGVFRTFGMNPLAAYVFHSMIGHSLESFTPGDAPLWYCWVITGVFMGINYLFVRHLERHNIYIRL